MVSHVLHRRAFLSGITASSLLASVARAEGFIELDWDDLLPKDQTAIPNAIRELLPHDEQLPLSSQQPTSTGVRTDWNGQIVRIPGFIVPIDYNGSGVTAFILVPYVGACVHVPPPPANQLVFVTSPTPYETKGMFEPVNVIGMFGASSLRTHLAEIGYALSADKIEPYRG
ncbi:MAG: DUF3299 domain-containing protein [Cognatishimia sp.]